MKSNYTSINFKQWLNKLQQESWQLELLISGFSIFGLVTALDPLQNTINEAVAIGSPYRYIYSFLNTCCYILIMNLIIHVIFRGLWIGTIGLRYVSGDIDYDSLNYSERFTKYLKKRIGAFDKYISNLEDLCSILFAMTFLVLFYFIAFLIFTLLIVAVSTSLMNSFLVDFLLGKMFVTLFIISFFFSYIFIFIDFITQGYLKKKKWTSFFYLPIYKIFSYLTLSFLYRPLLYNFLDNKFGKRVLILLVPIYISIIFLSEIENVQSNYISKNSYTSVNFTNNNNYINTIKKNRYVKDVAINSKIINNSYIKVFVVYKSEIEDILFKKNEALIPEKEHRGIKSNFLNLGDRNEKKLNSIDSIYGPYLKTFNNVYELKIDTTKFTSDFIITKLNKQLGFETVLPLKAFSEGKHILKVSRLNFSKDKKKKKDEANVEKQIIEKVIEIPFWYYKN